ncbi:MAG: hypothetical protein KZQ77_15325 [Candidatus Thiodiazotropha sp. (ex Notomyrtea botanica)]|nr:hypothetical protein [Candidatus Thiodiazotropha sp. (ex Notomyrtea botanica)]
MRIFIITIFLALGGCDCDSICEANKETKDLLSSYKTDADVVKFLKKYNGEGPGSEKFSVFVAWGVEHPMEFISIMDHENFTSKVLNIISYKISESGYIKEYCDIFYQNSTSYNAQVIRQSILGCKHNAL